MKRIRTLVGALCALLLATSAAVADGDKSLTERDRQFLQMAAEHAYTAIAVADMTRWKSKNRDARKIATMVANDNRTALKTLKKLAADHDWPMPTRANDDQQRLVKNLGQMSGTAYTRTVTKEYLRAYNQLAPVYRNMVEQGGDSHAREFAAKYLPAVQSHAQLIQNLAGQYRMPTTEAKTKNRKRSG